MVIKKPNIIFLTLICIFIIVEILFLRPSPVDTQEETTTGMFSSIEDMLESQKFKDEVGYTIDGFHYTSVEGETRQWEMIADQAVLYEKSRLIHAKHAVIRMFEQSGKFTNIEGDEAFYKMSSRDLDLEGNVKVTFPDDFWMKTNRAHYASATGEISSKDAFYGESVPPSKKTSPQASGELMHVWGVGFIASKFKPEVHILKDTHVELRRLTNDEITDVKSDTGRIDRFKKVAYFAMNNSNKFVESVQGSLHVRSRRQEATYDSNESIVKYMTAYDDVLIREMNPSKLSKRSALKYATSQKAEFLTKEDKIILSGFPSAYQEHDTLTGEVIIIYRKKNLVEVSHANAYHDGQRSDDDADQNP